jgi:RNA polymerase sigma-70 factor (ECF subfamily)
VHDVKSHARGTATDEELMAQLRAGRSDALDGLVGRYERELFHYLKRYVGDATLAEDVFQNTFLQVFLKRELFDPVKRFKPWLYAVATNQAIDALRRAGRGPRVNTELPALDADGEGVGERLADVRPGPPDEALRSEEGERVRSAVDALSPPLRQVVLMAYFQGLKYREIAEALGIPVGTVKSRLFSAVQLLQQNWGAFDEP